MALVLLSNTGNPSGVWDGYDALSGTSGCLGGEIAVLTAYGVTGSDKHAKDTDDGYSVSGLNTVRPIVTTTLGGSEVAGFFLTDDGLANYGTLFGTLVGSIAGKQITGGAVLGPHSAAGSGKITLWQNPGLYGVTLDALDATLAASTSVTVGTALYYTSAGKLCLSGQKVGSAPRVAQFVEFATNGSLVNTPTSLTRVGISGGALTFHHAVINFNPVIA